ncbi:MAG: hypothetical protein ACRDTG_01035 [Pseudonocardiaceae bacterium]
MDYEDQFPPESIESSDGDNGVRIRTVDGSSIVVRTDQATRLASLDLENSDGALIESRVLGVEDLQRLLDALDAAREQARTSVVPVVLDVSAVIGRD